jgi:hypothetical protein
MKVYLRSSSLLFFLLNLLFGLPVHRKPLDGLPPRAR